MTDQPTTPTADQWEEQVKELLLFIQAGDNRTLSRIDLELWMSELPQPLNRSEGLDAVKAFRARPEAEVQRHAYLDLATFRIYLRKVRELELARLRREASSRALPPTAKTGNRRVLRDRDPAKWDEQFNAGRILGNGDRAYQQAYTRTHGDTAAAEQARETEQRRTADLIEREERQAALKTRAGEPAPIAAIITPGAPT